jgi:hypothetical protein
MFFSEPDFAQLASFLTGYLYAIEQVNSISLNSLFSEWLNVGPPKTSLFWPEYILHVKADGDPNQAYTLLLVEFKRFLKEKVLPFSRTGFWKRIQQRPQRPLHL